MTKAGTEYEHEMQMQCSFVASREWFGRYNVMSVLVKRIDHAETQLPVTPVWIWIPVHERPGKRHRHLKSVV